MAAAGTLSLGLVGCEKPADEQQHVTQPEVVSTEDTSSVDGGLEAEASSKYPNIENTAGFSDDENLIVCLQGKEYALSWGDALISSGWDKTATEVDSTRCEGKGYPRDGGKSWKLATLHAFLVTILKEVCTIILSPHTRIT